MQHLDEGTLHALVDGEVASEELGAIRAHLETCADCRVRLDEARAMADEAEQLVEAIEVPAEGRKGGTTERRKARPRPVRTLAWAASIVVAAGLGYVGGREQGGGIVPDAQLSAPAGAPQAEADAPAGPSAAVSERFRAEREPVAGNDQERRGAGSANQIAGRRLDDSPARDLDRSPAARLQEERVDSSQMAKTLAVEPKREPAPAAAAAPPPVQSRTPTEAREVTDAVRSRVAPARLEQGQRAAQLGFARRNEAAFVTVSFEEANRLLGGRLRRLDGLVPERVQARGLTVQVIYPLPDGVLILEQSPDGDSVAVQLTGPPSIGPDSLARLYSRIR
jgi:Putative zinc-finger